MPRINVGKRTRPELIVGQTHCNWTVVAPPVKNTVLVRCKCGREKVITVSNFRNHKTESCRGCCTKFKRRTPIEPNHNNIPANHLAQMKLGAIARKIKWHDSLTREFLVSLINQQNFKCALSGLDIVLPLTNRRSDMKDATASLDRIDSEGDYEPNNVQWVHKVVNLMKSKISQGRFIELCAIITKHNHDIASAKA